MRDYENASKLFSLPREIQLAKEGHSRIYHIIIYLWHKSGADPGFQVRVGGALKKIAPRGGRSENVWGISCEKSRICDPLDPPL